MKSITYATGTQIDHQIFPIKKVMSIAKKHLTKPLFMRIYELCIKY
jgi:hypothetical protein